MRVGVDMLVQFKMWRFILVISVLLLGVTVFGLMPTLISKGEWIVDKTAKCENPEQFPYDIDLRKRKVNRTHYGFYMDLDVFEPITEEGVGIYIEACKIVDGGCRTVLVFEDASFCRFITRYAEDNFKKVLRNLGMEEHCPIPAAHYHLDDYIFDNRELADEGMVGAFVSTIEVLKGTQKMACLMLHVHFEESDEADLW